MSVKVATTCPSVTRDAIEMHSRCSARPAPNVVGVPPKWEKMARRHSAETALRMAFKAIPIPPYVRGKRYDDEVSRCHACLKSVFASKHGSAVL